MARDFRTNGGARMIAHDDAAPPLRHLRCCHCPPPSPLPLNEEDVATAPGASHSHARAGGWGTVCGRCRRALEAGRADASRLGLGALDPRNGTLSACPAHLRCHADTRALLTPPSRIGAAIAGLPPSPPTMAKILHYTASTLVNLLCIGYRLPPLVQGTSFA